MKIKNVRKLSISIINMMMLGLIPVTSWPMSITKWKTCIIIIIDVINYLEIILIQINLCYYPVIVKSIAIKWMKNSSCIMQNALCTYQISSNKSCTTNNTMKNNAGKPKPLCKLFFNIGNIFYQQSINNILFIVNLILLYYLYYNLGTYWTYYLR